MGMVVRSNIMAVNSQRQLNMNNSQVSKSLEKLSSGYRINRAGDDASGLAISEKMKSQIKGLDTASLNAQDGISLVQTAEGALTEVHNMLNRMTELATRAANGINDDINRESLQKEVKDLKSEIDRIADSTDFNGLKLLNGEMGPSTYTEITTYPVSSGASSVDYVQTNINLDFSTMLNARSMTDFEKGSTFTFTGINGKTKTFEFVAAGGTAATGNIKVELQGSVTTTLVSLASIMGGTTAALTSLSGVTFGTAAASSYISAIAVSVTGTLIQMSVKWKQTSMNDLSKEAKDALNATTIDSSSGMGLKLQIGATADDYNQMSVGISDMGTKGIGIADLDISTQKGAAEAIDIINTAIDKVSAQRATMGAIQNRLEYTINNLDTASENLQAANSRIRDTDMAKMMMEYTKTNVLTQSAQAMLAQANQQPQSVLQLLQ